MINKLNSKQRAKLKSISSTYETIFQIGKNGIGEELIKQLSDALNKRELIKIRVLETCEYDAKEASIVIAEKTLSEVVQVIGSKIILFRQNDDPKKRVISLA
ncbi:MAG: YhbY family RNA-binding protein [Clostridiales bacterium]|nr:YhbY family RNA-binding protein [Clostridiales bacterium]